jgi:phosphoglycolate phosphatase
MNSKTYLLAIRRLNSTKADTVYIGNSMIDAETAQVADVGFIGVARGVTAADELCRYPHLKIISLLDELLR